MLAEVFQRGAQIGEIDQQHAFIIGKFEYQGEYAFLGFIQVQQAGNQLRAHLRNGRAHRCALLTEDIPEGHRVATLGIVFNTDFLNAFIDFRVRLAGLADTGNIALDIRQKHRYAKIGEAFCEALQRDGFAGAGGPGNQAVAVGVARIEKNLPGIAATDKNAIAHTCLPI